MSSVANKHIDGDVSVGRHVTAGGNATVRGRMTVDHNLIVKGDLDARNLRGPVKGLFLSKESLDSAYPNPKRGWVAFVGRTLPAQVYMAIGGEWVAQYNDDGSPQMGGELNVALDDYVDRMDDLSDRMDDLEADMAEVKKDIASASKTANEAKTAAEAAKRAADAAQGGVDSINKKIGEPGGIAPLGGDGKVATKYLPEELNEVIVIDGCVAGVAAEESTTMGSTVLNCGVVYDSKQNVLLLRQRQINMSGPGVGGITMTYSYYKVWGDWEEYGTLSGGTVRPTAGKVYINEADTQLMVWTGTELKAVPPGDMERITESEIDDMF